jgi:hypothetical protein
MTSLQILFELNATKIKENLLLISINLKKIILEKDLKSYKLNEKNP